MADANPDATALARWAAAHGFTPSERLLQGETPLLRQGMMDIASDAHEGELDGRLARIFNLYVDAPGVPLFGDTGTTTAAFTVLLVGVDAPAWPRVTIHPAEFSEGDWLTRLLRHDDHRVRNVDPELVAWCVAQPGLIFDLENNVDTGDSLVVAGAGDDLDEAGLDGLAEQARWLAAWFERPA